MKPVLGTKGNIGNCVAEGLTRKASLRGSCTQHKTMWANRKGRNESSG